MSLYGCQNKPRPEYGAPLLVQQGWNQMSGHADDGTIGLLTRMVEIPYVMSTDCQYTKQHASDPQCMGCIHQAKETP
jgi:hypothetical protein